MSARRPSAASKPTRPTSSLDLPTALLTGFEPWGPHKVNPSGDYLRAPRSFAGWRTVQRVLPVSDDGLSAFEDAIQQAAPAAVISLGLAADRSELRLECRARRPADLTDGPAVLTSGWLPTGLALSTDAGAFYCNALFYRGLRLAADRGFRMAFLHLPPDCPDRAVTAAIARLLRHHPFSAPPDRAAPPRS